MPVTFTTTDDEVISKTTHPTSIEQRNIDRLLITGRRDYLTSYFYRFQRIIYLPKNTLGNQRGNLNKRRNETTER